jgi:two-component system sensor histidine kinase YesM
MNRGKRFVSLRLKILVVLFVVATIPIMLTGYMMYAQLVATLTQKQDTASLNSLGSVATNVTTVMDNVREISLQIIQNEDLATLLKNTSASGVGASGAYLSVVNSMAFYIGQKSYLSAIRVFNDSLEISRVNNVSVLREQATPSDIVQYADSLKGGQVWFSDFMAYRYTTGGRYVVSMLRNVNSLNNPAVKLGTLRIDIDERALAQLFVSEVKTYGGQVYLVDSAGKILSASDSSALQAPIGGVIPAESIVPGAVEASGEKLVCTVPVAGSDWRIISVMPISYILNATSGARRILLASVLISFALCVLLSLLTSRYLLSPLMKLADQMKRLKENNYRVNVRLDSNDEIGVLYESFNEMSNRLDELINQVFEQKLRQEETELKALQAQINPHFLYNNLDTAYWMSRLEGADKTGRIVQALSNLFRLSIRDASQVIPVATELEHIRNYIVIQEIRFDESVRFALDVMPGVEEMGTARFVLQPLVENALYHGILPGGEGGCVDIRLWIEEGDLLFAVSDDGVGGDPAEMEALLLGDAIEGTRGLAIRNVHQRIRLRYGERYGLSFSRNGAGGITSTVRQKAAAFVASPGINPPGKNLG